MMDVYGTARKFPEALNFLMMLHRHYLEPDIIVYNTLLKHCVLGGLHMEATRIFKAISTRKLIPTRKTYNLMIDTFWRAGKRQEAFDLLDSMKFEAKLDTYHSLMKFDVVEGKLKPVQQTFNRLLKHGLQPTTETYNLLMDAFARSGKAKGVRNLWQLMKKKQVEPDFRTLTTFRKVNPPRPGGEMWQEQEDIRLRTREQRRARGAPRVKR